MDFGSFFDGKPMGVQAVACMNAVAGQLKAMIPGLSDAAAFKMIGVTPMIGLNDTPTETFSLNDVATVTTFVKAHGVGLVSFWASTAISRVTTASISPAATT